jgi:hypothetical protein
MATTYIKKRIRTNAEQSAALEVLAAFKVMAVERLPEHRDTFRTIHDELAAQVRSEYRAFCEQVRGAGNEAYSQIVSLELD